MKNTQNSRVFLIKTLRRWLKSQDYIDRLIADASSDRAFVTEVAYGVARWKLRLDWMIDQCCRKRPEPLAHAALLTGFYQLFHMDTVEPYAAVNETVEALKACRAERLTGFVNGVMRSALRRRDELMAAIENQPMDVRQSHPKQLTERWTERLGAEPTRELCDWNNSRPNVVIRPRCAHITTEAYLEQLNAAGMHAEPHPDDLDRFVRLPHGVAVPSLPGYNEGWFAVQDPATAAAVDLLDLSPDSTLRVLDACAAPGGKTTLILDQYPEVKLAAMDSSPERLKRLRENLYRLGLRAEVQVCDMTQPPGAVLARVFDRILLDVPCTNTGVLRRRPDARWHFSTQKLTELAQLQTTMLDTAAALLAPGGAIVYSTCSLEPEENDNLVANWCSSSGFRIAAAQRHEPPDQDCDGAFAARLERE